MPSVTNSSTRAPEPSATDVATPGRSRSRRADSSCRDSGLAISAPPPKPMMARPVARPGRSGNHLISVETGEM